MKPIKMMLVFFAVVLTAGLAATPVTFAEDTIKIGEVQTYSKIESFTHPYRNGWQLDRKSVV